ncbi:MAG: SDR family NAD(P)-dependent oxidoreductase, partial [Planctomycetes bacterium]|nr:SDR family NAD(P)-dependent oxidoreductase [Planctomycetota bacterium]
WGTGEALADLLRRHGGRCIRAFAGTEFARISEDFFTISSGAGEDYRRLLVESGGGEARALAGVVHLWNLDAAAADQLDLETLESAARVGCGSVLHLVRALAGAELAGPPRLWLVTSRAQAVADGERVDGLAQSALWGLGRALALEHPELSPVRVDVDVDLDADLDADLDLAGSGAARVASLLFDEMSASTGEDQIAFRGGARHVARLARVVPAAADGHSRPPESIRFSPDVSYLITGGTGGLGRVVARWMVERGARHLVLVGRGEPNEHCSSEFGAMRDSGAQLLVLQADVASRHDVAGVLTRIEESLPRLAGIIHAAGVSEDGYLSQMAWEDFARAVSAKVRGAWNLHDLTLDAPLDFFVLFSSAAALLGSPGGGSYGAGNAFLDALAHRRRALGLPGASVNWGPWTGIGMATDAKSQAGWNAHGMRTISVAASLEVLSRAIDDGPTQVATLAVDWSKLLKKTTVPPFLADFAALPPRQTVPRRSEFVKQLESVPASERRALLVAHVRDQIVNVLSIDPAEPIDLERGFFDLGLDSLTLVELRNRLQSSLSMSLPATLAFDYPTPSALVEHLAVHVPAMNAADASGKSESARAVVDAKSAEPDAAQPVAIVGMSCRMPGGATLESFWQMLRDGGDATSEVPADRWDVDSLYDPDPNAPGKICCRRGAFLPQVDQFDPDFFGIS